MNIALLTDGIQPFVLGGMQRHSFFLVKYLIQSGHKITLYHCVPYDCAPPSEADVFNAIFADIPEVQSSSLRNNLKSFCFPFPKPGKLPGHYLKNSYRYSATIYNHIRKEVNKYNFIYAQGFCAWKLLNMKKKGLKTPPIGIKLHGMNMFQKPPSLKGVFENLMMRYPATYNMKHADYVFSHGGKITDIIEKNGVARKNIIEIPTGINKNWVASNIEIIKPNKKINFLFVGRYDKVKGIKELYQAISKLPADKVAFHFIGPFQDKDQLKLENVIYYGKIINEDSLIKITDTCDVSICVSHSEGMPNAVIEAMARGLLVLATDTGALPLLVDNHKNGILIEKCTTNNIIKGIEKILKTDLNTLNKMKQESLNKIKNEFNWDQIINKLVKQITLRINDNS